MIPFNRPTIAPNQLDYVQRCFASGHLTGDGPFSVAAAKLLSGVHSGSRVLLTPSCTAALELSALLLNIEPGDEVIVPSFTFSSTAGAFALMGATIVFCDVEEDTLNIDPVQVEQLITPRTRAIVPIHYGGAPASSTIYELADQHQLVVIEDNAHGLFGQVEGRPTGTSGQMSTLSFHGTKNITCGEGGALIVNDPHFFDRAEILREKGTNRARFFRGAIDKYSWVETGSSYLLADVNAAILLAQLEHASEIQERRRVAWDYYSESLADWGEMNGVHFLTSPDNAESSFHLFGMLMPSHEARTELLIHAKENGVGAVFHYVPLDTSAAGLRVGSAPLGCAVSADVSDRLIRLPLFSDISKLEYEQVAEVISDFS